MAESTLKSTSIKLYNKLFTSNIDGTGNVVLGSAFDNRLIVNVQTTSTLVCWALGVASSANNKMLHFWNYDGTAITSRQITYRVFWFEKTDFIDEDITS